MLDKNYQKRFKTIPEGFVKNLSTFNLQITDSEQTSANLKKLNKKEVLTVVTGQQVGIFISPVLALYKAISAIKYAKYLEAELNCPVVPIFWLQTEDHDYEEIRSAYVLNKDNSRNELSLSKQEGKTPIGLLKLTAEIEKLVEQTGAALADYMFANEVLQFLKESYQANQDFGLSFAKLITKLIPNSGLIFLDPTVCELSKYSINTYKVAIDKFEQISAELKKSSSNQVALRDDATLYFFLEDKERERLIKSSETNYKSSKKTYSVKELHQEIETNPAKFSASALLRPLVQDTLLPTYAYIGGAAEINYLKQSEKLYPLFNQTPPQFIKRPSFTVVEQKSKKWLEELQLSVKELNLSQAAFVQLVANKTLKAELNPEAILSQATAEINSTFEKIEASILKVDQTLINSATKAKDKSLESIKLLLDKYSKAALLKEQVWSERLMKVKQFCFPEEIEQERTLSAIYFYAKFGPEFVEKVYNAINTTNLSEEIEIII